MANEAHSVPQLGTMLDLPVFMGKSATSIMDLFQGGLDMFFILGYEGFEYKEDNITKKSSRSALYLVMKNLVGYSITPASDQVLELNQMLKPDAFFSLPKIPWELQERMAAFFHKVYELHGTESVLLLIYDENYLGSEDPSAGWGCIAPKQENTSGSCNYEIDEEVMALKSDSQTIVGSIHSHPGMDAFFSHTDHKDQAEWDGLHITIGWKHNKPDEYHIEMIMGRRPWTYQPESVFATPPKPALEESGVVDQWLENVTKKASASIAAGNSTATRSSSVRDYSQTQFKRPDKRGRPIIVPAGAPGPDVSVMIGTVPSDAYETATRYDCVLCGCSIIEYCLTTMRCFGCSSFIALESETIDEFYARYVQFHNIDGVTDLNPDEGTRPIYMFYKNPDGVLKWSHDLRTEEAKK